jgi:signal peptidase I
VATVEAGTQSPLASPWLRLAGYLVDSAVTAPPLVVALYVAGVIEAGGGAGAGIFLSALTWVSLVSAVYFIIPTAIWGQTVGKWAAGTKVLGPAGDVPGWGRAAVRAAVGAVAGFLANTIGVGILDPLWLLWDRHRQTLHDKAAGTIVIRIRPQGVAATVILSLVLAVGVQLGLVFGLVRPFIVQAYYVPSASMAPTLLNHDRLLVNKLSYRRGKLRRGDIVVFQAPKAALYANPVANPNPNERKDFIKRLVALPGDTVKVEDGRLYVKEPGEPALHTIEEPYLKGVRMDSDWGPVTVPEGNVLVFGDNRNNSNDSRHWVEPAGTDAKGRPKDRPAPFLPIENIHGRAFFRYWPPGRWGELPRGTH